VRQPGNPAWLFVSAGWSRFDGDGQDRIRFRPAVLVEVRVGCCRTISRTPFRLARHESIESFFIALSARRHREFEAD